MTKSKTIRIVCQACRTQLYTYRKGGTGILVKCFVDRILQDSTVSPCTCPKCGAVFAKPVLIQGRQAHKIIPSRVSWGRR